MFFDDDHGIPDADLRVADSAHAGVPHDEEPNAPEPTTETDQSSTAGEEEQNGAIAARTEEPEIGDSVAVAGETTTAEPAAAEPPEAKESETAAAKTSRSRNFLQRLWGGRKSAKATPVSAEVAELFDTDNAAEPEIIDLVGTDPDALETAVEEDVARLFTGDTAAPDAEIEHPDDAEEGVQDVTLAKHDATDDGESERADADEAPDLRHVHGSSLAAELDVDHEIDRATEAPEDEPEELPDLEEELDRAIEALEDDSDETPDRDDEGDALDEDFAGVFEDLETVDWDEDSPAEAAASIEEHRGEEARTDSAAPAAEAGESLLDDILRENEQRDEPREVIAEASGIRVQLLDESDLGDVDEEAWESLSAKLGLGPEEANAEEESAAPIEDSPAAVDKTDDAAAAAEADELETDTDKIYQSFVASTAPAATAANPELAQTRAAPEDDAQAPKRATTGAAPFPGSPPPRARRWLLLLATLLMAILLVAQLVHARRDALLQDPTFGPRLRAAYAAFGYELPPDWDLNAYDLRQRDAVIAPQTPDVIRIKISLRNRADRAQPYPVVRLVLIDTWGEPIGQRDLLPSQYLGSAPPPLLGPGERVTGEIAVADPKDGTATSFEIDACLSMGPAGLECAGAR
jgi:hypothetical protein